MSDTDQRPADRAAGSGARLPHRCLRGDHSGLCACRSRLRRRAAPERPLNRRWDPVDYRSAGRACSPHRSLRRLPDRLERRSRPPPRSRRPRQPQEVLDGHATSLSAPRHRRWARAVPACGGSDPPHGLQSPDLRPRFQRSAHDQLGWASEPRARLSGRPLRRRHGLPLGPLVRHQRPVLDQHDAARSEDRPEALQPREAQHHARREAVPGSRLQLLGRHLRQRWKALLRDTRERSHDISGRSQPARRAPAASSKRMWSARRFPRTTHGSRSRNGSTPATGRGASPCWISKTMRETPLAESRSVDDQATWLDNDHVLYGYKNAVWAVRADGSDHPRLYLPRALSPTVVRPAHSLPQASA